MKAGKTLSIFLMMILCLTLYTVIISRMDRQTNVIFGGVDGAYVSSDSVTFIDLNAVATPVPTENIWPDIDINLPIYAMVNQDNLLSSAYEPENGVVKIKTTKYQMFSADAVEYLDAMIEAMQEAGFNPWVASSYRTYSYQAILFNQKAWVIAEQMGIEDYLDPEYAKAAEEAASIVMKPGSSEHQLGTAVDLMDKSYNILDYNTMDQTFFAWLDEHCAEYGFIKRYPTKKLLLTGWDEPWHYRYVGREVAEFIMEHGICYEEFYSHYVEDFEY